MRRAKDDLAGTHPWPPTPTSSSSLSINYLDWHSALRFSSSLLAISRPKSPHFGRVFRFLQYSQPEFIGSSLFLGQIEDDVWYGSIVDIRPTRSSLSKWPLNEPKTCLRATPRAAAYTSMNSINRYIRRSEVIGVFMDHLHNAFKFRRVPL